jgi:tRNA (guanine-N7-)-methyltransferase
MAESASGRRTIRSFVRRTGRLTPAQGRALDELWPTYGIDFSPQLLDLDEVFGRAAERVLEIGFGNGETLVEEAALRPEIDFLGVEVHQPGIGHCLIAARDRGLANLRIIKHDAVEVLQQQIGDGTLARINLYFPDPGPRNGTTSGVLYRLPFCNWPPAGSRYPERCILRPTGKITPSTSTI